MFRRKESSVPKDFVFPTDLSGLGYFINDRDQIRMIKYPDMPFHYYASKNERYVQMQKEAMNEIIRQIVQTRLLNAGLKRIALPIDIKLPIDAAPKGPHVPILVSKNLDTCKRVILYIGESNHDLGVLAGRMISNDRINLGSAVDWVTSITSSPLPPSDQPGIIISNPGTLVWWRRGRKAISHESWQAIPRKYAVGPGYVMTEKNVIESNETPAEHFKCIFDEILLALIERKVKIDIVAVEDGALDMVQFLQREWAWIMTGMNSLVIITSYVWDQTFEHGSFGAWFGRRARAYLISSEPFGTPLRGREDFGCNVFSGQENHYVECIFAKWHAAILDYFKLIEQNPDYVNEPIEVPPAPEVVGEWGVEGMAPQGVASHVPEVVKLEDGSYGIAKQIAELNLMNDSEKDIGATKEQGHDRVVKVTVDENEPLTEVGDEGKDVTGDGGATKAHEIGKGGDVHAGNTMHETEDTFEKTTGDDSIGGTSNVVSS